MTNLPKRCPRCNSTLGKEVVPRGHIQMICTNLDCTYNCWYKADGTVIGDLVQKTVVPRQYEDWRKRSYKIGG